jgi:hypothetical protein
MPQLEGQQRPQLLATVSLALLVLAQELVDVLRAKQSFLADAAF